MNAYKLAELIRDKVCDEVTDYELRGKLLNVMDSVLNELDKPSKKEYIEAQRMPDPERTREGDGQQAELDAPTFEADEENINLSDSLGDATTTTF